MKSYKKIVTGLCLLVCLLALKAAIPSHALAACAPGEVCGVKSPTSSTLTKADLDNALYTLINAGEIDGTIGGSTVKFIDSNPLNSPNNFKPKGSALFCDGTTFGNNGLADKFKGITLDTSFNDLAKNGGNSITAAANLDYINSAGNCVNYQSKLTFSKQADGSITTAPPSTASGATATSDSSCESNFSSGFEWIMCPALRVADNMAGGFNGFVEDQLCVNTGPTSSTGGVVCKGNDNLNDSVKTAWGIFKNIATAVLVIVMLVMVISQAIGGGGPFDAYTVRKMLPRLVAAAILMQLSWVLFKWSIDLSNDLGKGIQSLLYAPFGGANNMQLDKLIGSALKTQTSFNTDTFALFSALAVGTLVASNLAGLLTLALFVVVALATAFFVLVLRKILILLLIILAPLALIAWILPSTQKYWKMWSDNLVKLLLMFPMIMGLIAAGRIFAYIVSGGSQPATGGIFNPHLALAHLGPIPIPYIASVTNFADLAIIIFAYFGPYLLMPKAFSWGGQFMSAAVNQVNKRVSEPTMKRGQEGIKGIGERYAGYMGNKYNPEDTLGKRLLFRVGSGHYNPLPIIGKRSQRLAIQEGEKYSSERNEEAASLVKRVYDKALVEGYEGIEPGVGAAKQALIDLAHHKDERIAKGAIKQLINTSSWVEIEKSRVSAGKTGEGKKVFEDNVNWQKTIAQDPELYPKVLRSRVDAAPHVLQIAENRGYKVDSAEHMAMTIDDYIDNEGFQTQSEGFWKDAAAAAAGPNGHLVTEALQRRFQAIYEAGPTVRQQMLGHLVGGSIQAQVDAVLGPAGTSVMSYIRGGGAGGGGPAPVPPPPPPPPPPAGPYPPSP